MASEVRSIVSKEMFRVSFNVSKRGVGGGSDAR